MCVVCNASSIGPSAPLKVWCVCFFETLCELNHWKAQGSWAPPGFSRQLFFFLWVLPFGPFIFKTPNTQQCGCGASAWACTHFCKNSASTCTDRQLSERTMRGEGTDNNRLPRRVGRCKSTHPSTTTQQSWQPRTHGRSCSPCTNIKCTAVQATVVETSLDQQNQAASLRQPCLPASRAL